MTPTSMCNSKQVLLIMLLLLVWALVVRTMRLPQLAIYIIQMVHQQVVLLLTRFTWMYTIQITFGMVQQISEKQVLLKAI